MMAKKTRLLKTPRYSSSNTKSAIVNYNNHARMLNKHGELFRHHRIMMKELKNLIDDCIYYDKEEQKRNSPFYYINPNTNKPVSLEEIDRGFFETKGHWVKRMHKMGIKVYGIDQGGNMAMTEAGIIERECAYLKVYGSCEKCPHRYVSKKEQVI